MMFRRWARAAALLALLGAPARGQKIGEFPFGVDKFQGENTFFDSARLEPGMALDAANLITEHGYLERRPGSSALASFPYPPKNLIEFVTTGGSRYLIAHASQTIYQTDLSTVGVALATVSVGAAVDFVNAFGKILAVDGTREIEWNGTTVSTNPTSIFPGCLYLEFQNNRVWCANIGTESASRVRISSFGSTNYFTVPPDVTAVPDGPNFFEIQRDDGYPITCLKKTPWGMVVGKRFSTWIVKGYDNTNWYVRSVDPAIGCIDDRSMQVVDGRLMWLAVDGVYSWDGSNPVRQESQQIEAKIRNLRQSQSVAANWTTDSQAEWQTGSMTINGPSNAWDLTALPGSIFPSSASFVDTSTGDFLSGTLVNLATVTAGGDGRIQVSSAQFIIRNGDFELGSLTDWTCSGSGQNCDAQTNTVLEGTYSGRLQATCGSPPSNADVQIILLDQNSNVLKSYTDLNGDPVRVSPFYINVSSLGFSSQTLRLQFMAHGGGGTGSTYRLTSATFTAISTITILTQYANLCPTSYGFAAIDGIRVNRYFSIYNSSAVATQFSRIFDTAFSTPVGGPFSVSSGVPAGVTLAFQVRSATAATGPFTAWSNITNGNRNPQVGRYQQYLSSFSILVATLTAVPYIDVASQTFVSTGNYYSQVKFIDTRITAWKQANFTVTDNSPGLQFLIRAATYSFTAASTAIAWTSHTNNTTIVIATGSYVQFRIDSSSTNSSSQTIQVDRAYIQWQEGSGINAASVFHNHHYFLGVAASSTAASNDEIQFFQRNGQWVHFNGANLGLDALTIFNGDVVGSNASSGKVWRMMQDGVYTDDTAAIDASWVTPDYLLGDPVSQKVINEMWMDAAVSSTTLLNVSYAVDRSTVYYTRSIDLGLPSSVNRKVPIDAGRAVGKYFRMKFQNAQATALRINAFTIFALKKERTD